MGVAFFLDTPIGLFVKLITIESTKQFARCPQT